MSPPQTGLPQTSPPQTAGARRQAPAAGGGMQQVSSWSRDIRFVSGMILLFFAATHFLNHAVGIAGVAAMEQVQGWRLWIWYSWPGTIALYASLIVHPFFALLRVAQRRTFSMPVREMAQIALGLAIPLFLVDHIVGTRVMGTLFELDGSYHAVLRRLWPGLATSQTILLLLVWLHGMIGLHFTLRTRNSYARWRDVFMLAAILVPILSLIGFAVAGREAALMALPPETYTDAQITMFNQNVTWSKMVFFGLVGAFVAFVAFREIRVRTARHITVRFVGHGVRKLVPGLTVLEMFRRFGIPHAALCGGRARCATCRVLVLDGADKLPAPGLNEAKLLRKISAPDRVRLACQIRPRDDLQVQILLAARLGKAGAAGIDSEQSIGRRGLTVMVADLRAFAAMSERQLPNELLGMLNRFYDEMGQAVSAHGGRIESFYGDGFMAVFGLEVSAAKASAAAIAAAGDIVLAVEALNREFGQALPLPLRIGVGIHSGQAVVGALESESLGRHEVTVGETVMIASQLQLVTRRVLADIVVSEEAMKATGRRYRGTTTLKIAIKGLDKPVTAFGFTAAPVVAQRDEDDEAEPPPPPEREEEPVDAPAPGEVIVPEDEATPEVKSETPTAAGETAPGKPKPKRARKPAAKAAGQEPEPETEKA